MINEWMLRNANKRMGFLLWWSPACFWMMLF